jgi:hypothetical protein
VSEAVELARVTAGDVAFALEQFRHTRDGRVEIAGRWFGLGGRRFTRPALTVRLGSRRRRLLAEPSPGPWTADEGELWRVTFSTPDSDEVQLENARLSVARGISMTLPLADANATASPGDGHPSRAEELARLRAELASARAEREGAIKLRDTMQAQRDAAMAAADTAQAERAAAIGARDRAVAERRRLHAQRQAAAGRLAALEAERDRARSELAQTRDALRRELIGRGGSDPLGTPHTTAAQLPAARRNAGAALRLAAVAGLVVLALLIAILVASGA